MLSNTRGLQKRMAHAHRSDATFSTTLCPHIIQRGSCPEYAFEQTLRRRLVNLREESLKAEAVRLLTLEHEVAESEKEEAEGVAPPAAGATATGGNVWRPKFDDIAAVIETMKREKAYQDWSLDTAVAKELAKQSRRSCSYSHTDLRGAASSAGNADSLADDTSSTEGNQTTPIDTSLGEGRCPEAWRKQFQCLNPYQKLALLLLLRTRIRVPVGNLVSDVEELVRDARRTQKRQLNGGESDDDEDDEDEEISAEDIEATSKRLVTRTLVDVQRGLVNLSYYPHIVSYAVREPQDAFGYGPPSSTEEEEEGKQTTQSTPPPVASMSSSSVAAASTANKEMVHLCRCLCWDLISRHQPHHANNKSGETTEHKDHHPTPQSKAHVRRALIALGIPKSISAKEVDLSSSRRTGELFAVLDVLAVWWSHMVKYLEVASMSLLQQQQQQHQRVSTNKATGVSIPFRLLSLRGCCLSSAEELIALVRKHGYQHTLVGLDLSSNRLDSLRFLFQLRAEFKDRLLFLGLKGNPITKKPDYREQVRATLPMLVSLDGEPIRRPPLSLPFPKSSELPSDVKPTDYAKVVATLERFLYVFETQQVPNINTVTGGDNNSTTKKSGKQHDQRVKKQHRTEIQQQRNEMDPFSIAMDTLRFVFDGKDYIDHSKSLESISDDDDDDTPITAAGAGEVEADENTFAKKYLDQDCCTTIFASNGCAWFDETTMRTAIEVELDSNYTGCRMSGQDVKELRVMDVSVRNHSRNLLVGKPALHRVARGPVNCFTMYQSTLYPQRMKASHEIQRVQVHVIGSEDDSVIVPKVTTSAPAASSAAPAKPKPVTRDPYAAKALPQAILDRMKRAVGKLHPMQECGPQLAPQVAASDVFRRAGEEAAADADGNSSSAHGGSSSRRPKVFVVTLHGVMRWRAPTMASEECITSAFHRTITLVPRPPAPPQPQPKRRRRQGALDTAAAAATSGKGSEPPLLIVNDMILLQPVVQDAEDDDDARRYGGADSVCFTHMRSGKTRRLAIEYGLDHPSGLPLVQHVLERATSDAAAHMVLRRLVFDDENDDPSASALAGSQASLPQSSVLLRQNSSERIAREMTRLHSNQGALIQRQQTSLKIDSSLWISELQCNETSLLNNEENRGEGGGESGAVAATTMKRRREMVSFAELDEMLVRANAECTTTFA